MRSRDGKRPYEKPLVTRVRLSIEHSVFQQCHSNMANQTGTDLEECWVYQLCMKYEG